MKKTVITLQKTLKKYYFVSLILKVCDEERMGKMKVVRRD
jgi:hypothetical protein